MDIEFMSWALYDLTYLVVHGKQPTLDICIQTMYTLDGFLLLQNYNKLSSFLKSLEVGTLRDELCLLVDGLLGDHEPLSSFGYQDLFEKGYISHERWKSIQSSLIENDLDMIEEGVQAAIDEEETSRSEHQRKVNEILLGDGSPQNFENSGAEQRCQNDLQGQHSLDTEMEDAILSIISASTNDPIEPVAALESPFHDRLRDWNSQNPSTDAYPTEMPSSSWICTAHTPPSVILDPISTRLAPRDELLSFLNRVATQVRYRTEDSREAAHLIYHQRELRIHLQGAYESLEAAWLTAVINGSSSKVREMLEASWAFHKTYSKAVMPLFDLDMIADESWGRYSGMTSLMIAVVRGNAKLVHSLLAAGVAVNMLTAQGTALSLAAKSDSSQIIQLLLAKNASLEDAISVLSTAAPTPIQTDSDAKRLQAIQRLEELALALPKEKKAGDLLRQLHSEFSSTHAHISETIRKATTLEIISQAATSARQPLRQAPAIAQRPAEGSSTSAELIQRSAVIEAPKFVSTGGDAPKVKAKVLPSSTPAAAPAPAPAPGNVEGVLPSWAHGIERLKRPAWNAGMSILRKLTRGQVSRKVGEVVMLLTIVKSMSTVLDFRDGESSDSATKFSDDLTRWQWLFNSEDGSLQNFRDAVHVLWGVKLATDDSILDMPPGVDQLTSMLFQVMAMNVMAKISPILHSQDNGDLGNGGLLASQSRWKASHRQPSCGPTNFGTEHGEEVRTSTLSGRREDDPHEISRRFSMLQLSPVVEFEPIVIVLASGAIFGILLLFLISKSIPKYSFIPVHADLYSLTVALSQYWFWSNAFYHIQSSKLTETSPTSSFSAYHMYPPGKHNSQLGSPVTNEVEYGNSHQPRPCVKFLQSHPLLA
jgi:hypothetical protein